MGATAESAAERSAGTTPASRLGFRAGQVVQEFGYDDDVDEALRASVEERLGTPTPRSRARCSSASIR